MNNQISRDAQDQFAGGSQNKAEAARTSGRFKDEIIPVTIKGRYGDTVVDADNIFAQAARWRVSAKTSPHFVGADLAMFAPHPSGIVVADDVRTFEAGFERQVSQRPSRIDVIPAGPMRRRWTAVAKARIIASSSKPGANIAEIARTHELLPRSSNTAEAIGYTLNHWKGLVRFLEDGRSSWTRM